MSYQQQGGQQGGQQGYGQYNPYGQQGNPYQDQGNPYGNQQPAYGNQQQQPSYGSRPQAQAQGSSSYYNNQDPEQGQGQGGYEMANMNGNDPNRLLNETRSLDRAVDELQGDLDRLAMMQNRALDDTDTSSRSPVQQEVDKLSQRTIGTYTQLTQRVKKLKSDPESGNPRNAPQVGKIDRRLKTMIQKSQRQDSDYRKRLQERIAREYRIVRPDASDAEIREATEDPNNTQIFSQALINSDRRGQAQSIASNVRNRHQAIQKIEQDMIVLAQLFQDLEAAVVQQEPAVAQIEQRGEETTEHVSKANEELGGAVTKARAARRKKWWCFGIIVLIIIIIAVVVAVAVTVTKN